MKYGYRTNINSDPIAAAFYSEFKKALKIPVWEPLSDGRRMAFDEAFLGAYDPEKFLLLCSQGASMADCLRGAMQTCI